MPPGARRDGTTSLPASAHPAGADRSADPAGAAVRSGTAGGHPAGAPREVSPRASAYRTGASFTHLLPRNSEPSEGARPAIQLALRLFLGDPVSLLDLADELVLLAGDVVEVIIRELRPLLLRLAADLLPIACD